MNRASITSQGALFSLLDATRLSAIINHFYTTPNSSSSSSSSSSNNNNNYYYYYYCKNNNNNNNFSFFFANLQVSFEKRNSRVSWPKGRGEYLEFSVYKAGRSTSEVAEALCQRLHIKRAR